MSLYGTELEGAWLSVDMNYGFPSNMYTQIKKRKCFLCNFLFSMGPFCVQGSKVHAEEEDSTEGSSTQQIQLQEYSKYVQHTLQRRLELCISRNQTARPCSQFEYSYICERIIHSQDRPILGIYKSLSDI
jgi:hypothetical protein